MSQRHTNWSFLKPLAGRLDSAWACLLSGVLQTRPQIFLSPFLSLPETVVPVAEQPVSSQATTLLPGPLCPLSSFLEFPECLTTGPLHSCLLYSLILFECQYKCQLTVFLACPSLSICCPHALSHAALSYLHMAACIFLK